MVIKHEKRKLILCMIAEYIILFAGHINSVPLHTPGDELGAIVSAAKFAGLNWNNVASKAGYYGFGYYGLFFPLFCCTDNPYIIYRVIAAVNALIKVCIIPLSFYIAKKYLTIKSEKMLYFAACLMPLLRTYVDGTICNEYPLEVMFWVVALLCCKAIEYLSISSRRFILFYVLLLVTGFYMLTLHTRALIVLIALIIILTALGILYKRKILFVTGIIAFCGYFLIKKIIILYQIDIWSASGDNLVNASVKVVQLNLFSSKTWEIWAHMLLGLVGSEAILTAGSFISCMVIVIWYLYRLIMSRFKGGNAYCNIILALTILCMGATMAGFLCSNWFEGLYQAWGTDLMKQIYERKALTYVRYWNVYMPPLILCSLAILSHCKLKTINWLTRTAIAIFSIVLLSFYQIIVPLINNYSNSAIFFMPLMKSSWGDKFDIDFYGKMILISLSVAYVVFILYSCKKKFVASAIVCIFMVTSLVNESFYYDDSVELRASSMIQSSYNLKCKLEKEKCDIGQIYLNDEKDSGDNNWRIYYVAQFYFNRYSLQTEIPTQLDKNDIIISANISENIQTLFPDINIYVLDENEVWYTYMNLDEII